ncbi:MAG: hypothetical protein Q8R04_04915 [Nanoarchaeota archaeon]|nr:hypothetical protein [Nanoarchaeota archaeon]
MINIKIVGVGIASLLILPIAYSQEQITENLADYWLTALIAAIIFAGLVVVYAKRNVIFKKLPKMKALEKINEVISALKANIVKIKEKKYQNRLRNVKERKEAWLKIFEEEKKKTEEIEKHKLIASRKERKLEEKPAEKREKVDFLKSIKSIFAKKVAEQKVSKESKGDEFSKIKQQFKKLPSDSSSRFKLEIAIARKIVEMNGSFCISDVMKKMDTLYQMSGKERIDVYDDIKSLVNGELCQKVSEKNKVLYYRFV